MTYYELVVIHLDSPGFPQDDSVEECAGDGSECHVVDESIFLASFRFAGRFKRKYVVDRRQRWNVPVMAVSTAKSPLVFQPVTGRILEPDEIISKRLVGVPRTYAYMHLFLVRLEFVDILNKEDMFLNAVVYVVALVNAAQPCDISTACVTFSSSDAIEDLLFVGPPKWQGRSRVDETHRLHESSETLLDQKKLPRLTDSRRRRGTCSACSSPDSGDETPWSIDMETLQTEEQRLLHSQRHSHSFNTTPVSCQNAEEV